MELGKRREYRFISVVVQKENCIQIRSTNTSQFMSRCSHYVFWKTAKARGKGVGSKSKRKDDDYDQGSKNQHQSIFYPRPCNDMYFFMMFNCSQVGIRKSFQIYLKYNCVIWCDILELSQLKNKLHALIYMKLCVVPKSSNN